MATSTKPMRFSINLFPYDRWGGIEPIAQAAKRADELGFFGVSFPEHIVMPVKPGVPPVSAVWYDNFVLASHIATVTQRIRLIFNVMVVPYRPPIQMAKLVSTLDVVSQGRLILGVGAGWLRGEFRVLGLPHDERGAMTDEYLRAMRILWTEENPEFEGKYVSFSRVAFLPKCVQKPHVPIWVGGSGPRPLRRTVELGDGWSPMVGNLDELSRDITWIKEQVRAAGRDPDALDFSYSITIGEQDEASKTASRHAARSERVDRQSATTAADVIEMVRRHQDAGLNHLGVGWSWERPADYMERLEWFASDVLPAFPA
ncbi:MAG: LLM class F420-dependent oxidoreductase [Chloroflexi bacterium]|nr:LLM class F420-dependent oxidoreductase [Chloroflexota bacterium]MCH8195807.1 LLM class F420-dependent oxidoreductase [Chloroflexota bacterium]MCH8284015.1 LLM class F420-dependent oxidoreductase [Chloroflexota bacterium]MCI0770022.1 LLM class F420-dependent oxidoreductase [Chloroflexota bacterium]